MTNPERQVPRQLIRMALGAAITLLAATPSDAAPYHEVVISDGPLVYYRFEDPAGSSSVTNAITAGSYDAMVFTDEFGSFPKFEQAGIGSNSVSFHPYTPPGGTLQTSRIELPYAPELNGTGPFTIECWARPVSWGSDHRCPLGNFGGWVSTPAPGWWFRQTPGIDETSRWIWVQNGGGIYMGGIPVVRNQWDHLVATYDGASTVRFYVNGALAASSLGIVPVPNSTEPLRIGGDPGQGGANFDGNVDEVAFYTKVLTPEQIQNHYAVGLTNFRVPTVAAFISGEPSAASVDAGRLARFLVSADGTAPLAYQWYKNEVPIGGATTDTLEFIAAYSDNGALYKVVVTNAYGGATSAPVALTVLTNLTIVTQPASVTRTVGGKAAFIGISAGALPVSFQWYKDSVLIPGETNQTLWVSDLKLTDDGKAYYVRISNPWMSTNSETATLTVVSRAVDVPVTRYAKVVMNDDPVAFWRLDEPAGSMVAVDAAGSFDGTYTPGAGSITYEVASGIPHETNTAISVTGKSQVIVPWALELNPYGPFSTELWFKPDSSAGDYRTIFSSEGFGPGWSGPNGWLLYQTPDATNTLVWVLFNEAWRNTWVAGSPASGVQPNKWYHAVLAYDGTYFRTYLNGELVAETIYGPYIPNRDQVTSFGYRSDNNFDAFDGDLDDIAFYNKALKPEQAQAHYLATVRLGAVRANNDLILTWPFGILQQADQASGPFNDLTTATSPYTNAIGTSQKFFRVKVE